MVSEGNIIDIENIIQMDSYQSESDWCKVINYFECFLNEKYGKIYTIDILKDVKQYIDWYFSVGNDKEIILSKENFSEYELYLKNIKHYKKNTIVYKRVAVYKLNKFIIKINQRNNNVELDKHPKKNRSHYNYLTKMYIML